MMKLNCTTSKTLKGLLHDLMQNIFVMFNNIKWVWSGLHSEWMWEHMQKKTGSASVLLWSVRCALNSEAYGELCFFPHLSFHGASLRYFHLFWEKRSIIRNATETTQAHIRTLIPLHLSHQIVQGRKYFCDKARPSPWGNHNVQLDWVIW